MLNAVSSECRFVYRDTGQERDQSSFIFRARKPLSCIIEILKCFDAILGKSQQGFGGFQA